LVVEELVEPLAIIAAETEVDLRYLEFLLLGVDQEVSLTISQETPGVREVEEVLTTAREGSE
jgi:hypothetical protein